MKVLHYFPASDRMIAQHVSLLTCHTPADVQPFVADTSAEAHRQLGSTRFDLLHLHGCWRPSERRVVSAALSTGARLVLTPHGQLEPWIMGQAHLREKLPKQLLYVRRMVRQAYAVIVQGRMEQQCLTQLAWNPRLAVVPNSIITRAITPSEMTLQTCAVYRRVMDSNPWPLMDDATRGLFRQLLKVGITGDRRWADSPLPDSTDDEQWRRLLLYARQEGLTDTVGRGLSLLGLTAPDSNWQTAPLYRPSLPQGAEATAADIDADHATPDERLRALFGCISRLAASGQLTVGHLVELDRALRSHDIDEDRLAQSLRDDRLYAFARRVVRLAHEATGLDEGYMPVPPLDDRRTQQLRQQIYNHLTI